MSERSIQRFPSNGPTTEWRQWSGHENAIRIPASVVNGYPLAPDSILTGDEQGMSPHVSVAAVVRSLLDSAVDDLASAYALISEAGRLSPVGIPTLIRGTIELSGLGMWVLTGQERPGRQSRALRVAHDSNFNAKQFYSHLSQNAAEPADVREGAAEAVEMHNSACEKSVENATKLGIKRTKVNSST